MLTINSASESRTEPVSATPRGDLTIVISIVAVSAQFEKSAGEQVPPNSGTTEQMFFAPGNRSAMNCPRSAGYSVIVSHPMRFSEAQNLSLRLTVFAL